MRIFLRAPGPPPRPPGTGGCSTCGAPSRRCAAPAPPSPPASPRPRPAARPSWPRRRPRWRLSGKPRKVRAGTGRGGGGDRGRRAGNSCETQRDAHRLCERGAHPGRQDPGTAEPTAQRTSIEPVEIALEDGAVRGALQLRQLHLPRGGAIDSSSPGPWGDRLGPRNRASRRRARAPGACAATSTMTSSLGGISFSTSSFMRRSRYGRSWSLSSRTWAPRRRAGQGRAKGRGSPYAQEIACAHSDFEHSVSGAHAEMNVCS